MPSCFVLAGLTGDEGLESGLATFLPVRRLAMPALAQGGEAMASQGDVCLLAGSTLGRLSGDQRAELASATVARGVNLIVLPPFGNDEMPSPLPGFEPVLLSDAGDLAPAMIVDDGLAQACHLRELTVLYTQVVEFAPARPLIVSANGRPVALRYRHSSNWGQLIISTLLLASASGRSLRAHRVALAQGLVAWLGEQVLPARKVTCTGSQAPSEREHDLALLALARQPDPADVQALGVEINAIRSMLGDLQAPYPLEQVLQWLQAAGVVRCDSPSSWQVDADRLAEELALRHLGAYLRRLR